MNRLRIVTPWLIVIGLFLLFGLADTIAEGGAQLITWVVGG